MQLESADDGEPLLPEPGDSETKTRTGKEELTRELGILRAFVTYHWRKKFIVAVHQDELTRQKGLASSNPKLKVAWAALSKNQGAFIEAEYLPEGITLEEPTKMG